MKKTIFILLVLIISVGNSFGQDYNSIKGFTWKCVKAEGVTTPIDYVGSELTINSDNSFRYYHSYTTADLTNDISGTYIIDNKIISFPTSRIKTTMSGKTTDLPCVSEVNGNQLNFCMLTREIKIITNTMITMTIKAKPNSEITEDIVLTLKKE